MQAEQQIAKEKKEPTWLTADGVQMKPLGYAIMAVGLLRGLGVSDAMLALAHAPLDSRRQTMYRRVNAMHIRPLAFALALGTAAIAASPVADAFCGFYVAGADAKLFNNATMVVMMREGTRTVLSMRNNYQGPPENFAMVVPVPVVLQQENVKTLPAAIFDKVDQLAAPRLVEYWEQDPCQPDVFNESARALPGRA